MTGDFDPYRELGLSPEAAEEPELVRAAFKTLAKKYHPDSYTDAAGKAAAEQKMTRLNEAQRQILSGEYRPPSPARAAAAIATVQPSENAAPATRRPAVAESSPRKTVRTVPMGPMVAAFLLLLLSLAAPLWLKRDHLAEAERLEQAGQLPQALEQANLAVADDPRDPAPYLLRARLWKRTGEIDRARTDLDNTRGLLSGKEWQKASGELFPATPTPSASPSPLP